MSVTGIVPVCQRDVRKESRVQGKAKGEYAEGQPFERAME